MIATTLETALGQLTLTATEEGLSGLYFENHQHPPKGELEMVPNHDPHFDAARSWLDSYFKEKRQERLPYLDLIAGTDFQRKVWNELGRIPEGETVTYADIAEQIGLPKGVRAVGAAVGRNPVSIMLPCHRVVGSNGSLTGFAGGLARKHWLLVHERVLYL